MGRSPKLAPGPLAGARRRRSLPGRCWRKCSMWNSCSIAAARCRRTDRGKCARPYSVFCSTVRCGNSARSCKTYPTPRLATGMLTRDPASNKTRSPMTILPASGAARPATQSSSVVFPDPEGPNRMVNPGAALKSTSSENGRSVAEKFLRILALRVRFANLISSGRVSAGRGSAGVGIESRLIEVHLFDWTHGPYFAIHRRLMQGPPVQPVDQS